MNFICKGHLRNKLAYEVVILTDKHLSDIMNLQEISLNTLQDQGFLAPLSVDEYKSIINGKGLLLGCLVHDELIAFRALLQPDINEEHLGILAGLSENELHKVIYQEISIVSPSYRGHGLQQILGKLAMKELKTLSDSYHYVCATVAPMNIASLLDKFRQGMVVKDLSQLYGGKWRYVFFKSLTKERTTVQLKDTPSNSITILMNDFTKQQKFIKQGYIGYQLLQENEKYYVLYKHYESK